AIEAFHAEKGKHVGFSRDIFSTYDRRGDIYTPSRSRRTRQASSAPIFAVLAPSNVQKRINVECFAMYQHGGEKLRIVSTTMTLGSRTMTARTEIWNATKHRLCVSGTQIKMSLSPQAKL
ncbi:hypothetical protein MPER_09466, partial [Moniliophthora perniciosa FA553]